MLTFAIPKGRMLEDTVDSLSQSGMVLSDFDPDDRKLIFHDRGGQFEFVIVKPADVTTYVEYGAAQVGVAGKDIIEETESNVYEPLDLGFSRCRLSVAQPEDYDPDKHRHPRVATEFPNLAERHFASRGENVELIKLNGSVELAPLVGLSSRIVDIVSSGRTLRENGLVEVETILESSARLIVNRPAFKLHRRTVRSLINRFREVIGDD